MKIEFQQSLNISGEFFDIFSEFSVVKRTRITSQLGMVYKTTYKNGDTNWMVKTTMVLPTLHGAP